MDGGSSDTDTTDPGAPEASSPGSRFERELLVLPPLSDVGISCIVAIDAVSEPSERQLIPKRPVDSTSINGPPRVAIALLLK